MRRLSLSAVALSVALALSTSAFAATYYAATSGTPTGNGSFNDPWDIDTALVHPSITPGDTILIRGGTYGSGGSTRFVVTHNGTQENPIIVRGFPGERATMDGCIYAYTDSSWLVFRDLEVMNSEEERTGAPENRRGGFTLKGPGHSVVNCIIHDTGHAGIGYWEEVGDGGEVHGCLIWGAGSYDTVYLGTPEDPETRGCAIYAQNQLGTRYITDVIAFRNFTHGIKPWSDSGYADGFYIEGNTCFDHFQYNMIMSCTHNPVERGKILNNAVYRRRTDDSDCEGIRVGVWGEQADVDVKDNYVVAGTDAAGIFVRKTEDFNVTGNTVIGPAQLIEWKQHPDGAGSQTWNSNTYRGGSEEPFVIEDDASYDFADWKTATGFDASSTHDPSYPNDIHVMVRPNKYEQGRGHVTIFNWPQEPIVYVDLSKVLKVGQAYEIRDAQNYYGSAVGTGTYTGAKVGIPMNQTVVAQPIGDCPHIEDRFVHTAPEFGVYVIRRTDAVNVHIAAEDRSASETGPDTGTFRVHRTGSTTSALTVSYQTAGTATPSSDYSSLSGSVTIASGQTSATVTITPVDDSDAEEIETVVLRLLPGDDYEVDPHSLSDYVCLKDNDGAMASLLSHWKLDDTSGTVAIDSSNEENHGVVDGAAWTTGEIGGALDFDGTDDYVSVQPKVADLTTYTVSAWFRTTTTSALAIYSEGSSTTNTPSLSIRVNRHGDGEIGFDHRDENGVLADRHVDMSANDGSWHHVALVREDASTFHVYFDGDLAGSDTSVTVGDTPVDRAAIGAIYKSTLSSFFDGEIDDVRLYNVALDESDIEDLYNVAGDAEAPTTPTNLQVTARTKDSVSLSWSASTDNVGVEVYMVYRDGVQVLTTTSTSGTDGGLDAGTQYVYTVCARDNAGNLSDPTSGVSIYSRGLVGRWQLDEGTGTVAADSSYSENDGTLTNGPTWLSPAKINDGLTLDGSNDYVALDDTTVANETTFTISAWFKTTSTSTGNLFGEGSTTGNVPQLRIMVNRFDSGDIGFEHRDDSGTMARCYPDLDANDGEWHMVTLVRESASSYKFYLDGECAVSTSAYSPGTCTVDNAKIGVLEKSTGLSNYWNGSVDEVRIYDHDLSADEIEALYDISAPDTVAPTAPTNLQVASHTATSASLSWTASSDDVGVSGYKVYRDDIYVAYTAATSYTDTDLDSAATYTYIVRAYDAAQNLSDASNSDQVRLDMDQTGLIGHWALDDGTGTTADDASASGNDGALTNGPTWTDGVLDGALDFDGTDDCVTVTPSVADDTSFTVCAWFKTSQTTTGLIYSEGSSTSTTPMFKLVVNRNTSGDVGFEHRPDAGEGVRASALPDLDVNDGEWHHAAIVREDATTYNVYVDGVLAAGCTDQTVGTTTVNQAAMGAQWTTSVQNYFDGLVDDVRIYNRPLSADEVDYLFDMAE